MSDEVITSEEEEVARAEVASDEGPEVVYLDEKGDVIEEGDDAEFDPDDDEPEPGEVRAGGSLRADNDGEEYWLNLDQLREFNRMDRTLKEDKDFWAWFDAAKTKWGLKSRGNRRKRRGFLPSSWSGGSSGGGWSTAPKKYLSDWWGGTKYFGSTSDESRKLAIALQAVQTTIRVIDNHKQRMMVALATDEEHGRPSSYTAYDERRIQVSPMALLDKAVEQGEGIDITTGFALHEASHAEHSEGTLAAMRQPSLLRPVAVVSLLHNVLEDVRIEGLTGENFPGFVGYFEKALTYMWALQKDHVPATWGPELKDKMSAVVASCKWNAEFTPLAAKDPVLLVESVWWKGWVDRYQAGTLTMREALQEGLDRLQADPDTKKELDEMSKAEEKMEKVLGSALRPENLKKLIEQSLETHKLDKTGSCSSKEHGGGPGVVDPSGKRKPGIGPKEAEDVERLVRSKIEAGKVEDFKIPNMSGGRDPKLTILTPPETSASKAAYKIANPTLVQRMRSAFFFRPSVIEWTTRLQRSGMVDEDELWRAGTGDYRVFEQKHSEQTPDTSITLLIDASGSMWGYTNGGYGGGPTKVDTAIEMAQIMHACLKDMNGVRTRVRAHTGDNTDSGNHGAAIYRIWEHGEPITRLSLMTQIQAGNNYDGYAIGWCVREVLQNARPNEQKVIIVLSDGHPAGTQYGGNPAQKHVSDTVDWAARQGVDVVQVAIDPSMDPGRQASMFRNWVPFESADKLPMQMAALLRKIFPGR